MQKLSRQLKEQYDELYQNYPLYGKKCKLGEIDLLGIKGDNIDVYEVKCSYRIVKASKQLKRIRRVLGVLGKPVTNTYFYCGMSNQLLQVKF